MTVERTTGIASHWLAYGMLHAVLLSSCEGCGATTKTPGAGREGAANGAVPIRIPLALKKQSASLELSGIAWSAALDRYVMVSDDTASEGGKRTSHAPQVFTMSAAGVLDDAPLRIDGLDELNDPESITGAPDGTFFVATSHSVNKHGHLPASRRRLLHLTVDGRRLRIAGQVDLTEIGSGQSLLETARLDPSGALDVEALSYRDGALYIGLKAPLASDGSATILRLTDPATALAGGRIGPGVISFWSRARMCRPRDGREVCDGIADMTFLPDGSLLLVGNSPKGLPDDGGGSLWRMDGASKAATLVQSFPGLKPEGITLAPDGASAVIVFDTDGAQPMWTRLAVPGR